MLRKTRSSVIGLVFGLGLTSLALAGEAPVVDAAQDAENTQVESVGQGWQSMQNTAAVPAPSASGAPVEAQDAQPMQNTQDATQGMPVDQRVDRLSQQVSNMTAMNLPQQIADLRQKVSELQGELDLAERDLKIVSQQQARFYQDLSQRIDQLKAGGTKTADNSDNADAGKSQAASSKALTDASMYQAAFKLLANKQFDQADAALKAYLKQYPSGKFAANACYWLGEIAMHNKDFDTAFSQFQTVVAQYPSSSKVPDAKLKVAIIHAATGKQDIAKIEFQQIEKEYPGSTAAQLASIQLQQMKG